VQIVQGGGALVKGNQIGGDLQLDSNDDFLGALGNRIGGSLQAFQNEGGLVVAKNTIAGNLQCKENVPAPRGGRNVVGGNAEDQCAALAWQAPSTPPGGGVRFDCSFGAVTLGDDFEIPAGAKCKMTGTRVQGSIKLNHGSSLYATGVRVDGNVQAQAARGLILTHSTVHGSVQFEQGGFAKIESSHIDGSIQLVSNHGKLVATDNGVQADVQVFQNVGGSSITIGANTIDGNLQCKENDPFPVGGGNVVGGNKEDQCSGL
jgi:hypothetical protein